MGPAGGVRAAHDTDISFEATVAALTQPLHGQHPRPWMTDIEDPLTAKVFIVGRNQAKRYDATRLTHQRHLDALFNRNGESCRAIYAELVGGSSPTRQNIDQLRGLLQQLGASEILETNVICYSTPMSADLAMSKHSGGRVRGTEIFCTLLESVQPPVLIAHGARTIQDLSKVLGYGLPAPNAGPDRPVSVRVGSTTVFLVRSLASPEWWKWHTWAWSHLELVAKEVATLVK